MGVDKRWWLIPGQNNCPTVLPQLTAGQACRLGVSWLFDRTQKQLEIGQRNINFYGQFEQSHLIWCVTSKEGMEQSEWVGG